MPPPISCSYKSTVPRHLAPVASSSTLAVTTSVSEVERPQVTPPSRLPRTPRNVRRPLASKAMPIAATNKPQRTTTRSAAPESTRSPAPRPTLSIKAKNIQVGKRTVNATSSAMTSSARKPSTRNVSEESTNSRRRSTGPLSAHTMSQIRCPTRVDFLNAVSAVSPSGPSFGSGSALARSRSHPYGIHNPATTSPTSGLHITSSPDRRRSRTSRIALRTSRLTDEVVESCSTPFAAAICETEQLGSHSRNMLVYPTTYNEDDISGNVDRDRDRDDESESDLDGRIVWSIGNDNIVNSGEGGGEDDEDEECVPEYLNELVLDAMDRIGECDELKAIVEWMDLVRKEQGFRRTLTDIDLTNGIAMLQVLSIVGDEAFMGESDEARAIQIRLDQDGKVAKNNIRRLRAALQRFPWKDGPEGNPLQPVAFDRVGTWGLAGFVLLAALTGKRCDVEVRRILNMEEWMQDRLSDVLASGLQTLGSASSGLQTDQDVRDCDGNVAGGWLAEREMRKDLEQQVGRLSTLVEELTEERDQLVVDLITERRQAEQARAELRWLRSAIGRRRRVLSETNNDGLYVGGEEEFKDEKMVEGDGDDELGDVKQT